MGFSTEYLGHLRIAPGLNREEMEWLSGFADWGAMPDGDPFHLPMNPRAALNKAFDDAGGSMSGRFAVPFGVRDWRVCRHGDRISWVRSHKSNDAIEALTFLVEHYLGPEARAKDSDNPDFAAFTFDHRLDGLLVGERDDTEELFLIRVSNNRFSDETLVPGVDWWNDPTLTDEW